MKNDIKLRGKLNSFFVIPLWLTAVFAVLSIIIGRGTKNPQAEICCWVFTGIYLVVMLVMYHKNRAILLEEMMIFATGYQENEKKLLEESDIPYAVLNQKGHFVWRNASFDAVVNADGGIHRSIMSVFPQVTLELLAKNEEQEILLEQGERFYRASFKRADLTEAMKAFRNVDMVNESAYYTMVCLFDETELYMYMKQLEEIQMVSALVYIDNYDEVLETVEDVKQAMLVALVDRKVNNFFTAIGGLVKKTENDKYFVVLPYKALHHLQNEKVDLMDEVKLLKVGNEMALTLSMGLGFVPNDYAKSYEYSRMAIDLALGRGGDQIVLKTKEKTYYYGGKSRQLDKNTRVKARVKALALREIMISKEKIFVMGHSLADVDAFGSAIGIYCAARQLGKPAYIVIDEVTSSLRPFKECFVQEKGYPEDMFLTTAQALEALTPQTAFVLVDTSRPSYTESPTLIKRAKTIVVFDHHRQSEDVVKNADLSYIEPYASSACEMIAEVLQYFDEDIKLTADEADAIYAGILIDTNNFMTKTGVRTFEAAAYLRRCGAEVTRVRIKLQNDMRAYKARAEAIRFAETYYGKFALSVLPGDRLESPTIASAQAANELLNIIGIKASFVLTEFHEKIFISARSLDEINVQRLMEKLGGGGHINTAGAQLKDTTIAEAKKIIQNLLIELIEEEKQEG